MITNIELINKSVDVFRQFTMRVFLVYTFVIAVTDCYSFVLTQDGSIEAETDAPSDVIESRFSLCIDSQGIPIYGTASYKIDCRKFVHCAPGIEVVADCPSGLLYNEAIKVCDYPRQANCVEFKASDDTKLVIAENLIEW